MKNVLKIFRDFFEPQDLPALAAISSAAFLFPFFFSHLEFRHSLMGSIKSTVVIYALPTIISFIISKLYIRNIFKSGQYLMIFISSWILSIFLICDSIFSPLIIDFTLFLFNDAKSIDDLLSTSSILKLINSYSTVFSVFFVNSIPAFLSACGIFFMLSRISDIKSFIISSFMNQNFIHHIINITCNNINLDIFKISLYQGIVGCLLITIICPINSTNIIKFESYQQFLMADRDNNGIIDETEFQKWSQHWLGKDQIFAVSEFKNADKNKNREIDRAEWEIMLQTISKTKSDLILKYGSIKQC